MTAALLAGLLAGYGIAMPVGAVGAYLVALTARTSLRVGLAAALGVATADGLYALAAVGGGAALAEVIAPFAVPLRWLSVFVLVAVAFWTAVHAFRDRPSTRANITPVTATRAFTTLLGMTIINPMTVVYFAALVLGDGAGGTDSTLAQVTFVVAAFVASASWQALLAGGGALLGRVLTGRQGRLATALTSSAVMIALAVLLVV